MATTKGTPEGFHTLTPSITVKNCSAAIEFYKNAFGAEELFRLDSPDGKVAHAEIKIGDSVIFLADECDMGFAKSPETLNGTTGGLMLYVSDADAAYDKAVKAGAHGNMPVQDMFWGDRYGNLTDPFGHVWAVATNVEKLTPKQVEERARDFYAKMRQGSSAA